MSQTAAKSTGVVVPNSLSRSGRLAAALIYALVRGTAATVRFTWCDRSGQLASSPHTQLIFCCWHNRLALALRLYRQYIQRREPSRRMAALVSASKDGGLLARVLELFGTQPVRGSTSRRGPQALLELTSWAEQGFDLAITPDGPRGPRYAVQEGIIYLAQLTGLPIVPTSYYLRWKKCARSWDRFQVPLPFTRCEVVLGEPVWVPREASDAEREALRRELETRMRAITRD
jgi:lysophospholipid acyltransferase (LPLAT)-like uncharacterized protein